MRMKVITLIGLAVLMAASPASAAALFGNGGSGTGGGSFNLGNGVVSGDFTPLGGGDTMAFSDESLSGFSFVGGVACSTDCTSGDYLGTVTATNPEVAANPQAKVSEPLAALLVGLGLVGARLIRRRA